MHPDGLGGRKQTFPQTIPEAIISIDSYIDDRIKKDSSSFVNLSSVLNDKDLMDCSDIIQFMIDSNPNRTLFIPDGTFRTKKTIRINNGCNLLFSRDAEILATSTMESVISVGSDITDSIHEKFIVGGRINANNYADIGVEVSNFINFYVRDTKIENYLKRGLVTGNHDRKNFKSYEFQGEHIYFYNEKSYVGIEDNVACVLNSTDGYLSNIVSVNATIGFKIYGGGNVLLNCHPWVTHKTRLNKSVGFIISAATSLIRPYADSVATAFKIYSQTIIDSPKYYVNPTYKPTVQTKIFELDKYWGRLICNNYNFEGIQSPFKTILMDDDLYTNNVEFGVGNVSNIDNVPMYIQNKNTNSFMSLARNKDDFVNYKFSTVKVKKANTFGNQIIRYSVINSNDSGTLTPTPIEDFELMIRGFIRSDKPKTSSNLIVNAFCNNIDRFAVRVDDTSDQEYVLIHLYYIFYKSYYDYIIFGIDKIFGNMEIFSNPLVSQQPSNRYLLGKNILMFDKSNGKLEETIPDLSKKITITQK